MKITPDSEFRTVRGYQQILQQDGGLTPALEDYLEMVYRLCSQNHYTRVGKLSDLLHVKPSSASKMVFKLAELGYLQYDRYEIILLTDKGRIMGAFLLERHNMVDQFLKFIGISESLEETELIEHSINPTTMKHLSTLLEFFERNPDIQKRYEEFQERSLSI